MVPVTWVAREGEHKTPRSGLSMYLHALFKQWALRLLSPDAALQELHRQFRRLLELDGQAHLLLAEFSQLYHEGRREDFSLIDRWFHALSEIVLNMVEALEAMDPAAAVSLRDYHRKFDFYARFLLAPPEQPVIPPHVLPLDLVEDSRLSGNKATRLAAIRRAGQARVPDGFVVTVNAHHLILAHNQLHQTIEDLLAGIELSNEATLARQASRLQAVIRQAVVPASLQRQMLAAYDHLRKKGQPLVAVRSSAVGEDGVHSFAGQYLTLLSIDRFSLVKAYLEVLASRYTAAALKYRITLGLADAETPMAVLVVPMIRPLVAGVLFTRVKEGGALLIQAVQGLAASLVEGRATPMSLLLDRQSLTPVSEPATLPLPLAELRELARIGLALEEIQGGPLDIEWALDVQGLVILQVRPLRFETTPSRVTANRGVPLMEVGIPAAGGLAGGRIAFSPRVDWDDMVLVTRFTPPELARHLGRLRAVLAEEGAVTGHFTTVCREFGIPLLVQTGDLRDMLTEGQEVSVDGDGGRVYPGLMEQEQNGPAHRQDGPYVQRLKGVSEFILPLRLLDPGDQAFCASSCRSFHDIIRYAHEKGMQAMFDAGRVADRSRQAVHLVTGLPLQLRILDIGLPPCLPQPTQNTLLPGQVHSRPFQALWQGLTHPGIDWSHDHFDWKQFDAVALAGGMALGTSSAYASYGLVTADYVNLNLRFGYHFTMVDAFCHGPADGYCRLRFAGGGGDYLGRVRRLEFIEAVLSSLGFLVTTKADLLDGKLAACTTDRLLEVLDQVGRLLGATKVLDMVLVGTPEVQTYVDAFARGVYTYSSANGHANGK